MHLSTNSMNLKLGFPLQYMCCKKYREVEKFFQLKLSPTWSCHQLWWCPWVPTVFPGRKDTLVKLHQIQQSYKKDHWIIQIGTSYDCSFTQKYTPIPFRDELLTRYFFSSIIKIIKIEFDFIERWERSEFLSKMKNYHDELSAIGWA